MAFRRTGWVLVCWVLASPAVWAAGKDVLWEMTTKMDMPGMPQMPKGMTIPGMPGGVQKQTICLAEGQKHESKEQKECKVLEQKQTGRKSFVKVKCKEGTMTIEHEQVSKDQWRSKMVMSGEHEMTVNTEGKRIGSCDASKEGGMSRETQKMMGDVEVQSSKGVAELGKECLKAVADWPAPGPFEHADMMAKQRKDAIAQTKGQNMKMINATNPEVPHCAKAKVDYCSKSKAAAKEMGSRKGYSAVTAKHDRKLDPALQSCGIAVVGLLAGHCKSAVTEADYAFVAANCPTERKTLAAKYCAGRSYTAVEPKYQPLCGGGSDGGGRDYTAQDAKPAGAMDRLKGVFGNGSGGSSGGREYTSAAGGGAKDSSGVAVEEGVKQLKKLFGF